MDTSSYYMSTAVAILKLRVPTEHWIARGRLAYAQTLKAVLQSNGTQFDSNSIDIMELEDLCGFNHLLVTSHSDWAYTHSVQELRNELSEGNEVIALRQLVKSLAYDSLSDSASEDLIKRLISIYAKDIECSSWSELLMGCDK